MLVVRTEGLSMVSRGRITVRRCTTCGLEKRTGAKGHYRYVGKAPDGRDMRELCGTLRPVDRLDAPNRNVWRLGDRI